MLSESFSSPMPAQTIAKSMTFNELSTSAKALLKEAMSEMSVCSESVFDGLAACSLSRMFFLLPIMATLLPHET